MTAAQTAEWDMRSLTMRMAHLSDNQEKFNQVIDERLAELQEKLNESLPGAEAETPADDSPGEDGSSGA